jgi:hypothetical protein
MSLKLKQSIEKSIFQIKCKPLLSFYNKLYSQENIFKYFPHWQTDRLRVILRDYDKKHNLVIKHDSITFESDNYSKKTEKEVLELVESNLNNLIENENITSFGHRLFSLIPLEMEFDELVSIIKLKFFEKGFISSLKSEPDDASITVASTVNDLRYRIEVGPIKKAEIPQFIKFNVENHIDPGSQTKYSEIAKIYESYPETAFYMDMDIVTVKMNKDFSISKFHSESISLYEETVENLKNYVFESKIK